MSADDNDPRHLESARGLLATSERMLADNRARNQRLSSDNDELRARIAALTAELHSERLTFNVKLDQASKAIATERAAREKAESALLQHQVSSVLTPSASEELETAKARISSWEQMYYDQGEKDSARIAELERVLALEQEQARANADRFQALCEQAERERDTANRLLSEERERAESLLREREAALARVKELEAAYKQEEQDCIEECEAKLEAQAALASALEQATYMRTCAERCIEAFGPKKGMTVPYHGEFAGANPTVAKQILRFARQLEETLTDGAPSPAPCSDTVTVSRSRLERLERHWERTKCDEPCSGCGAIRTLLEKMVRDEDFHRSGWLEPAREWLKEHP